MAKVLSSGLKGGTVTLYGQAGSLYSSTPADLNPDTLISITFELIPWAIDSGSPPTCVSTKPSPAYLGLSVRCPGRTSWLQLSPGGQNIAHRAFNRSLPAAVNPAAWGLTQRRWRPRPPRRNAPLRHTGRGVKSSILPFSTSMKTELRSCPFPNESRLDICQILFVNFILILPVINYNHINTPSWAAYSL